MVGSGQPLLSYSAILDAARCREIDRRAYDMARTWYRAGGEVDQTEVAGVSLGRAFELVATVMLVRLYRATAVLAAIADARPIALHGVGAEWEWAARDLGVPFIRLAPETGSTSLTVPDPMTAVPAGTSRVAAHASPPDGEATEAWPSWGHHNGRVRTSVRSIRARSRCSTRGGGPCLRLLHPGDVRRSRGCPTTRRPVIGPWTSEGVRRCSASAFKAMDPRWHRSRWPPLSANGASWSQPRTSRPVHGPPSSRRSQRAGRRSRWNMGSPASTGSRFTP